MTLVRPPRWAERLLKASGADAEFLDDVLGDMAEEHVIRVAYDGDRAARRWYVREALRTLPHLLRDWRSRFSRGDARYLAGVILESYGVVAVCALAFVGITSGLFALLGIDLGGSLPIAAPFLRRLGIPGIFGLAMTCSLLGGYYAARRGSRAPIASSVGLGAFWCSIATLGVAVIATQGPVTLPWWTFAEAILIVCGTAAGGVLRLVTEDDRL